MPAEKDQALAVQDDDGVRLYNESEDAKVSKMLVGQGVMEGLARANKKVLMHPITILLWTLIALAIDTRMSWFPRRGTFISYLSPLIGFGLVALPLLGIVEYMHRPAFSTQLRQVIGSPDMVSIERYYTLDPRSTTLVSTYRGEIVGFLAIDGKKSGEELDTVLGEDEGMIGEEGKVEDLFQKAGAAKGKDGLRKRVTTTTPSTNSPAGAGTVQIRHLDVDQPVRRAGIATELLVSALDHVFGITPIKGSKKVTTPAERIIVLSDPFSVGDLGLFRKFGFEVVGSEESSKWAKPGKFGIFGWSGKWFSLSRSQWAERRETLFTK